MFDVSSQKDTITVKRKLTLKKDGILPGGVLDCEASIDLGVELNGSEGKGIVSKFESLFNGKISSKAKKQDERVDKARRQLAKWVHLGESENKIRTYADTQQEDIVRDWNQFMRVDIKRAANDALEDALKKTSIKFDDLKLKFSSVDLQDNKMEFMTGVLNIPGRGGQGRVAKAGMASMVNGLQKLGKPAGALRESWERNALGRMKKISETNSKISAQSSKGVAMVMQELAKHHKTAKLNKQDKIVIIANKALSAFNGAKKGGKDTIVRADTARLEAVLKDINRLLGEAEQLSKAGADAYVTQQSRSRRICESKPRK